MSSEMELTDAQQETYQTLMNMGFDEASSLSTARIFGANTQQAINHLLDDDPPLNSDDNAADADAEYYNPSSFLARMEERRSSISFPKEPTPPLPISYRFNSLSQMCISGLFHQSVQDIDHHIIFPDVVSNIIHQYVNLLFIKIQSQTDDSKENKQHLQYLTISQEKENHDLTFRKLALLMEGIEVNEEKQEPIKPTEYPERTRLWLPYGIITEIYSLPQYADIYEMKSLDTEDMVTKVNMDRWCELPTDLEMTSIYDIDSTMKDTNKFIEIMAAFKNLKVSNEDKVEKLDTEKLKVGDIIIIYKDDADKWYESIILSMSEREIYVHPIGLYSNANEVIKLNSSRIAKRGNYLCEPCRLNEWRGFLTKIGSKLDVYDIAYHKWYTAEVVEINHADNKVKIHYDGYSDNYDEWIEKDSYRLEKLNTHTTVDPFWSTFGCRENAVVDASSLDLIDDLDNVLI